MHNWVQIGSNHFKATKSFIVCDENGRFVRSFGLINSILSCDCKIIFFFDLYDTVRFSNHFQSYIVKERTSTLSMNNPILALDLNDMTAFNLHRASFSNGIIKYISSKTDVSYVFR